MNFEEVCTGIQHIGIPTEKLEETIGFYNRIGFQVIYRTYIEKKKQHAVFLQLEDLVIETYEEKAPMQAGAINHVAINCILIEKAYEEAVNAGLTIVSDGIEFLDFWDNGIKYFIISGPNNERIEFCEKL